MALLNCPECGKEVSDKATSCINCGYPMTKTPKLNTYLCKNILPTQKKLTIIIIIVAITLIIASLIFIKTNKKPVFRNLYFGMTQSDVVKTKDFLGEVYKDNYIVANQSYFDEDCSIVCDFDELNTLNQIGLLFDNKTYLNYSNVFNHLYNLYGKPYLIDDDLENKYVPTQKITWISHDVMIDFLYSSGDFEMVFISYSPVKDEKKLESSEVNFNDGNTQCSDKSDFGSCNNLALLWNEKCYETGCQIIGCENYASRYKLNGKGICETHYNLFEKGAIKN